MEKTTPEVKANVKQEKRTPDETSTEEGKNSGKEKGLSQEKVNVLVGKARTE
jgi:hypothetical protein